MTRNLLRRHLAQLAAVLLFVPLAAAQATIEWAPTLEKAQKAAEADGRPVIAYFTYETCTWCKQMEADTFPDPTVVALSKHFVWTKVDRDQRPDLVERFHVRAYPSFLVLGRKNENVHRFINNLPPAKFVTQLETGLARWRLYAEGKDWTTADTRPENLSDFGTIRTFPAPSDKRPNGLTFHDGRLRVLQELRLVELDPETGDKRSFALMPPRLMDVCSDGQALYGLEYGWTAGQPIHVIEPTTGHIIHRIVTEENEGQKGWSALGIAHCKGRLYVAAKRGVIHEVELETGIVVKTYKPGVGEITGLAWDGTHFVAANSEGLHFLRPPSLIRARFVRTNYPLRSVAYHDGEYYVMEQPVFGHDKNHRYVRLWPQDVLVYGWRIPPPPSGQK